MPTRCPSRSTPCAGRRTYTRPARAAGWRRRRRNERRARARASSSGSPSGAKRNPRETSVTNTGGTSAPHVALFEPYLLAASITLALGKTEACDSLLGLASWIALRRGGDAVSETQRARLKRLRGELRSRQGRTRDALEEFASAAVHAAEASGPQTPRVALELFKLADAFRETRAEDLGPDGDEARGEARDDETETETDAAANTAGSPHVNPTTTESALSASRCDAAATRIWLAAAADALGLLEESSAAAGAIAAFESRLKLTFSRQSRASFADLENGQLEEASQALGRVAAREAAGIGEGARDLAATASLARGLVLFVARERNVALLGASDAKDEDEGESPDAPFAPTFEEAVARVAEAIAAFPPSSNGAARARGAGEVERLRELTRGVATDDGTAGEIIFAKKKDAVARRLAMYDILLRLSRCYTYRDVAKSS